MQKAADKEKMKVVEHPGSLREALEWLKAAADQRIANVHECLGFNPGSLFTRAGQIFGTHDWLVSNVLQQPFCRKFPPFGASTGRPAKSRSSEGARTSA